MDDPTDGGLQALVSIHEEMVASLATGTFDAWTAQHVADTVLLVVAGKAGDPSEDRTTYGRDALLEWYTCCARTEAGTWDVTVEFVELSPDTFRADCSVGDVVCWRFFVSVRNRRIYFVMQCAADEADDMSEALIRVREHVPINKHAVAPPPCAHNSWDSVRARQALTMLRCRQCGAAWKIPANHSHALRCYEFLGGACPHAECRRIHIHARKMRSGERQDPPPLEPAPLPCDAAREPASLVRRHTLTLRRACTPLAGDADDSGASLCCASSLVKDLGFDPVSWLSMGEG
eukprot:gene17956-27634_t